MHAFQDHISEVYQYYRAHDHSLALRRLLDCVIETQDMEIFRMALDHCAWLEEEERTPDDINEKAFGLLGSIERAGLSRPVKEDEQILEVTDVSKTYRRGGFRLSQLNFGLYTRKITGLVGENGNGKTTLLKLLAAELKPDTGTIRYPFAKDSGDRYYLKTKLVYIEQRIPRWYGSLMDNLQFAVSYYHQSHENHLWTEMMIARMGLRPYRHLTWSRISSGYRTRFELARTLLRRPRILLLDEPLANLDINAQQSILQDLKFMAGSLTAPFGMILSSQHIYEVEKVSDEIIFLSNGLPRIDKAGARTEETAPAQLILEMELDTDREQLQNALSSLALNRIHYNGGVYLLYFEPGVPSASVFARLSDAEIEIRYFRNISHSSRRYFIS